MIGRADVSAPARRVPRRAWRTAALHVLTLLAVVTFVFALPRAMPGDPLSARENPTSGLYVSDADARARLLAYYGLDRPLVSQYGHFLGGLVHGDLGWSIARNTPVTHLLRAQLPWTLLLMGTSLTVASIVSFQAGIGAAWRRGRARDRLMLTAVTAGSAVPVYATAPLLLVAFAVVWPVLPLSGARTAFATDTSLPASVADVARHLALPAAAMTFYLLSVPFLLMRSSMLSALGQDYMVLARAKGLPERLLKYRHAGRNALLPFLAMEGVLVGMAVGAAIFVESAFRYPGMGTLLLEAVQTRDYPVLEAGFMVFAVLVLAVNLLLEIAYRRFDPATA